MNSVKSQKKNKRKSPQQAREKTHDDPGARASSKLAKELIDDTEIVEDITGLRLLAAGSSERRRTPWARAGGTLRKGDERRSTAPIGGKILPVDISGPEHRNSHGEDRLRTGANHPESAGAPTIESQPPKSWPEIEIAFLSDERVGVYVHGDRTTYNYGELGFEDRRDGKPTKAWRMLSELAESRGIEPRPPAGKGRAMIQKRIEEIREKLRSHFKIDGDPIPFNGNTYQASFKISRRSSFET